MQKQDCSFKCGGKCCKDFTLPVSPMELDFALKRFEKTGKSRYFEIDKIASMAIYKGDYSVAYSRGAKGHIYHYTCKHLNTDTGLCTNYENRPSMCKAYPYGGACKYKGCGLDQKKMEDAQKLAKVLG